jgi:hypothetical protein
MPMIEDMLNHVKGSFMTVYEKGSGKKMLSAIISQLTFDTLLAMLLL